MHASMRRRFSDILRRGSGHLLRGAPNHRRAVFVAVIVVCSVVTPFAPIGEASAVTPDVNIDTDDSRPPLGSELVAGQEYTFDIVVSYNLPSDETGVIKLYLPDAGGLKATREVTGTGDYERVTMAVTGQVPSGMAGENFAVSTILEDASGDFLEGDDGTYSVVAPVSNPSVSTAGVRNVDETSAVLDGTLDDTGGANSVDVWFEYRAAGSATWQSTSRESYGSDSRDFDIGVSGLTAGQSYEFRAVAENNAGTATGFDEDVQYQ